MGLDAGYIDDNAPCMFCQHARKHHPGEDEWPCVVDECDCEGFDDGDDG